jgi:hypothetical protein
MPEYIAEYWKLLYLRNRINSRDIKKEQHVNATNL